MKVVGLVSGGKDSCFAMMKCVQYGHEIVALANLMPADDSVDELDSYMYQTVGHQIVAGYAKCMGVPLFRRKIQGSTRIYVSEKYDEMHSSIPILLVRRTLDNITMIRHHNLSYSRTPGDEVEDMFILLKEVKQQIPSVTAVSSGAIASDYQRLRVESVCSRLGLISLAYLWKEDQSLLLQEMIKAGIVAITVKVAAIGLNPSKHLGKELSYLSSHLHKLKELYGINVCGEGGEYETLTLDCPLFKNARILLDEHQIILHSSNSIAPVGILHPSAFHLELKSTACISDYNRNNGVCPEEVDSVCEVQGDCLKRCDADYQSDMVFDLTTTKEHHRLHISKTGKNVYSISCWLQSFSGTSGDVQEDLKVVLMKIESQLVESGHSWEDVLYIHLYLADMNNFTVANETYVKFITQEKCLFGVPSRSTIEVPLLQAGLGAAYIEVLVAKDQCKKVLHVQSISCWAPSCIGPYSQATLHKEILHMAGQLGLDPPTMLLCDGGPTAEIEQALVNSEEVAKCFKCSIATSAILFVIYCSTAIPTSDLIRIQEKQDTILKQMKLLNLDNGDMSGVLNPMFLYILVPDLPKRAFVEVKPILYVADGVETEESVIDRIMPDQSSEVAQNQWDFQHRHWHDSCIQKCIVKGKICAVILSITDELAVKIHSDEPSGAYQDGVDHQNLIAEGQMERIARFCLYRLGRILLENCLSWDDAMKGDGDPNGIDAPLEKDNALDYQLGNLRLYFSTSLQMSHETLLRIFTDAFNELAETSPTFNINEVPIFNLVPVLGAGRSAASIDDIITCELLATKS